MGIEEFKGKSELQKEIINSVASICDQDFYAVGCKEENLYTVFPHNQSKKFITILVSKEQISAEALQKEEQIKGQLYYFYLV